MTYGITGIKTGLGPGEQVPLRREIDEWWFSKDLNDLNQRSLFIVALQRFMDMPPNPQDPSDLSFFSIAGIHGSPLTPWDTTDPKNGWYCAHGVETFPTWHRPYMLLYEQRLYEIMIDSINSGKYFASQDQAAMKRAADTWRLPFWDWAIKKPAWDATNPDSPQNLSPTVGPNVPFLLTQKSVQIKTVTGVATVPNPMWRYVLPKNPKFPDRKTFGPYGIGDLPDRQGKPKPYSACMATNRHPTTYDPKNKTYNDAWVQGDQLNWPAITAKLASAQIRSANTLPEAVYRLFSFVPDFAQFAKEGWSEGQPVKEYGSLEAVHGAVHNYTGGPGHMGEVDVAAFDPVFWLHHCNIDRLFAMWQDLYDDKYSRWLKTEPAKETLAPFHTNTTGSSYDSANCSYQQRDLGYTYPELQRWLPEYKTNGVFDQAKYKKQIRATIELKYSTTGKAALTLPKNSRIAAAHMANMAPMNLAVENFPPALVELAAPKIQAEAEQLPAPIAQAEAQQVTLVTPEAPEASEAPQQSVLSQAAQTVAEGAQSVLSLATGSGFVDGPVESWNELDYVVNVVFSPFELGGQPYTIRLFLGDVPQGDSFGFESLDTEIGVVYNFSAPGITRGASEEGCENCKTKQANGQLSSGQVVLTDYLVENIASQQAALGEALTTLSPDTVVGYLKRNLHWRVTDRYDVVKRKEDVPSLKISVGVSKVTHYSEVSRFSEYSPYQILWDVTADRLGGANPGELGWSTSGL